jgi:hypothetical protein
MVEKLTLFEASTYSNVVERIERRHGISGDAFKSLSWRDTINTNDAATFTPMILILIESDKLPETNKANPEAIKPEKSTK